MSRQKTRLRAGDVFVVPVDDLRVGFGQVVGTYLTNSHYFVFFSRLYSKDNLPSLDRALDDQIILLALSFDAKIATGAWTVVDHREVDPKNLPLPAYKEGVSPPGTFEVVDYSGKRRRRANADEVESLPNRAIVAPVRLEKALRAIHGLEPWLEDYEELRVPPEHALSSSQFRD